MRGEGVRGGVWPLNQPEASFSVLGLPGQKEVSALLTLWAKKWLLEYFKLKNPKNYTYSPRPMGERRRGLKEKCEDSLCLSGVVYYFLFIMTTIQGIPGRSRGLNCEIKSEH